MPEAPEPPDSTRAHAPTDGIGGVFAGRFKLREKLGEGGMGRVYVADQLEPVQRRVALKVLKTNLDSAGAVARFQQERQALALMDHPHIAKVFDSGTDERDRPFLVMELVKGIPITHYCDQEHLTPTERLELFIPVCQAIQHAHQKGIIHRDLKPSNILIALYDGKPVPKVIDFGVAKAVGQRLADQTIYTQAGTIVGTLEYMAPEQAELNNLDIDTRADIYSLGVVLYELLTGSPPFTSQQLRAISYAEMVRVLKEVEPARPSTRLSSSADLPAIAAKRKLEPRRLARFIHGDLDWIVMKCLEKERARRYETANGIATDLMRFLADEPVSAGAPSAGYRMRKFLKRHRGPVVAAALILLALVGGMIGTTFGLIRAAQAEHRANLERDRANNEFRQARRAVDDYLTQISENTLLSSGIPGLQGLRQKLLGRALQYYQSFAKDHAADPSLRSDLAAAYLRVGDITAEVGSKADALEAFERARELYEKLGTTTPELTAELARTYRGRADMLRETRHPAEAVQSCQSAIDLGETLVRDHPDRTDFQADLARSYRRLGYLSDRLGRKDVALRAYLRAVAVDDALLRAQPAALQIQRELAQVYRELSYYYEGDRRESERYCQLALGIAQSLADADRANNEFRVLLARTTFDLAVVQRNNGWGEPSEKDNAAAHESFTKSVSLWNKLVADNPDVTPYRLELGRACWSLANLQVDTGIAAGDEALANIQHALAELERARRDDPTSGTLRDLATSHMVMGKVQTKMRAIAQALVSYEKGIEILKPFADAEPTDNCYDLACGLSLAAEAAANSSNELTSAERARRDQYVTRSLDELERAADAGYGNLVQMKFDRDLEYLRTHASAEFQAVVAKIEGKQSTSSSNRP
jgi:tetratricopeptide (TPR) repeat protein/tRNA A-37 threonylcarbamoyl transferase component Bud32